MAHTEDSLRGLLNKIAGEQGFEDYDITLNEISSGGANYMSKIYAITIKESNKEDLHLFAKVAFSGKKFRSEMHTNVFDIERTVYTKLVKTYQSLEEECEVPDEHRLKFAKFYGCDPTLYQEAIVFENLMEAGYENYDRTKKSIDWEYASSAVREMAKLHALSVAYRQKYPEEFANDVKMFNVDLKDPGPLSALTNGYKASALKVVNSEYKESLAKFFEKEMDTYFSFLKVPERPFLIHGDFKGSNLLHRVLENGKLDIKIVDFQTIHAGSPMIDLLYFIFSSSDEQFRAEYYDQLIEHYYTQLSAAMRRLHLNPDELYSRDNFYQELKEKLPIGLGLAVTTLPLITVKAEDAPLLNEDLQLVSLATSKTSELYAERLNGVVNDFVKWGIL